VASTLSPSPKCLPFLSPPLPMSLARAPKPIPLRTTITPWRRCLFFGRSLPCWAWCCLEQAQTFAYH
jgi:hypothetical protein